MTKGFYSSFQGSMAMHGAGRRLGQDEGWRSGYDEGLAEGIALGRRQANDANQPQLNDLITRVRDLEARSWTDRERYLALTVVAIAAVESLGDAPQEQQIVFLKAYLRLCKEAADKKLLASPPDANPDFARANPAVAQFLKATFAMAMQQEADHAPSP